LEISERTARRDLEALGVAGLPVYSLPGRNGGWHLAGDGRTDLSGLTAGEVRALFLVAGPSAAATTTMRSAVRKLVRALPEPFRADAEATLDHVIVDPAGWYRNEAAPTRPAPEFLDAAQHAVVSASEVLLGYEDRQAKASERAVQPLGLASKGWSWYLIADTDAGLRTFRIDRITSITPTGRPAVRPSGFDLESAWAMIADEVRERRLPTRATAFVEKRSLDRIRDLLDSGVRVGPPQPDGRIAIEVRAPSPFALARRIAGLGAQIEITSPDETRDALARIGHELAELYGPGAPSRR
jgi:predicted DNA-binding transcriptional regulator YafY